MDGRPRDQGPDPHRQEREGHDAIGPQGSPLILGDYRHGATDSGPHPRADFSTNAHPLGPCPGLEEALDLAHRSRYPDPGYTELRCRLAEFHGTHPDRIVPGTGASELVLRLASSFRLPVVTLDPTFVEYRRCADIAGVDSVSTTSESAFLDALATPSLAFLCIPNNPDGRVPTAEFVRESALRAGRNGGALVLDLAYRSMSALDFELPAGSIHLWAPNKPLDRTGVRAGYLVARDAREGVLLRDRAASWALSSEGESLLEFWSRSSTQAWLERTRPQVRRLTRTLADILSTRGWEVYPTQANFLLARPNPAHRTDLVRRARQHGIRMRDASNMGRLGWYRFAARPPVELRLLAEFLDSRPFHPESP